MKTIIGRSKIWSYLGNDTEPQSAKNMTIRGSEANYVNNYLELSTKVANLQYKNPDYVLLFRGQDDDYKNRSKRTTLKPSLFRSIKRTSKVPDLACLSDRFEYLKNAENLLVQQYTDNKSFAGKENIKKYRILRWSILQHYEICFTPLLDVTHSLRVAASFASAKKVEYAYLYVIGVPNISASITANIESGLQIVRLSSVCPPNAVRPHIQEGYLLGEYPDMPDLNQKLHYESYEIDFGRRLITKFKFKPSTFWDKDNFPQIKHDALYPDDHDPLYEMAQKIKAELGPQE